MEIEDYAIKAMEALIRYGKMPMSNTEGVADTAWEVAKRMKELEQQVKSVDLASVGKSKFIWASFINWAGNAVTSCYEIESEDKCREMLEGKGFTNVQVRQIYF